MTNKTRNIAKREDVELIDAVLNKNNVELLNKVSIGLKVRERFGFVAETF